MYLHVPGTKWKSHYIKKTKTKKIKTKDHWTSLVVDSFQDTFSSKSFANCLSWTFVPGPWSGGHQHAAPFSSLPVAPAHSISTPLQLAGSCDWFQPLDLNRSDVCHSRGWGLAPWVSLLCHGHPGRHMLRGQCHQMASEQILTHCLDLKGNFVSKK